MLSALRSSGAAKALLQRNLASAAAAAPSSGKVFASAEEAVADIGDGSKLLQVIGCTV